MGCQGILFMLPFISQLSSLTYKPACPVVLQHQSNEKKPPRHNFLESTPENRRHKLLANLHHKLLVTKLWTVMEVMITSPCNLRWKGFCIRHYFGSSALNTFECYIFSLYTDWQRSLNFLSTSFSMDELILEDILVCSYISLCFICQLSSTVQYLLRHGLYRTSSNDLEKISLQFLIAAIEKKIRSLLKPSHSWSVAEVYRKEVESGGCKSGWNLMDVNVVPTMYYLYIVSCSQIPGSCKRFGQ